MRDEKSPEQLTDAELEAEFIRLFALLDPAEQQEIRGLMKGLQP